MRSAPASRSHDATLPLRFVGGDAALDLVNTGDWTSRGVENDRLDGYDRLLEWAEGAGVIGAAERARLRGGAARQPRRAASAYAEGRWTRLVLQRLFAAIAAGTRATPELRDFNALLERAVRHLAAEPRARDRRRGPSPAVGAALRLGWRGAAEELESPLWPVVWSTAVLLSSEDAARIRVCARPDCGWMYVDRSRNGLRRWCEMETCGTSEKTRRRRLRRLSGRAR